MLSLSKHINAAVRLKAHPLASGIITNTTNTYASKHIRRTKSRSVIFKSYHRCTKHQPYSVIGKLSFACNAIPAGSLVWQINTSLLIPRRIKSNTVYKELFASIRGVNNIGYTKVLFHCAARLLWNSIAHSNLALVCMLHFRQLDIILISYCRC